MKSQKGKQTAGHLTTCSSDHVPDAFWAFCGVFLNHLT